MSVNLAPIGNDSPFMDSAGNPLSGGTIQWYVANSTTPQDTYTTSAGNVANANPVVLGADGYPTVASAVTEIWLTAGVIYKAVLKNAAGTVLWTRDQISGINDTTVAQNEWIAGPAPTYVSATQFTLVGDQTSAFQVGRRIKTTNTSGTIYSLITASVFGAVTTVTVVSDSGTLDSGLSAVSYSLLSYTNPSFFTNVSFTATATGGTTAPANPMYVTKIGNLVTLSFPTGLNMTSNATTITLTGMPAAYRPITATVKFPIFSINNGGTEVAAVAQIATTGVITLYPTAASASPVSWTNGAMNVQQFNVTYPVL